MGGDPWGMAVGVRSGAAAGRQGGLAPRRRRGDAPFPEMDCLRARLRSSVLVQAEQRAAALGTGADRVLIAAGALSEEDYVLALSEALGVAFEPLDGVSRAMCLADDASLIAAAAHGMVPIAIDDRPCMVVAPRGVAAREITRLVRKDPARAAQFRFTTSERFNRFVLRCAGGALASRASNELKQTRPRFSAAPPHRFGPFIPIATISAIALVAVLFAPAAALFVTEVALAVLFLAWLGLRLIGAAVPRTASAPLPETPAAVLPIYTIIAALYREAASVDALLASLERLDYPREKLDVIVAVEADDRETRAALAARKHRIPITVIPVPTGGPRTKPRALNVALPFARGAYTVIYDAEDRPDRDQLRRALQAFDAAGGDLACVQARLCIDNTADSWLVRLFTAEYAGQFDVFLPGLAGLRLPLPLGGSSNHFRTEILRAAGAWDAYNVTEDADLGMRLARLGYRMDVIDSTTYEEAPARLGPWLRQRTRWFKGWMVTWRVHMRQPIRLLHELRLAGFLSFQLMVGGNVLAALVHPLFIAGLIYLLAGGAPMWRGDGAAIATLAALYGASAVIIGYLTSAFLGWLGLYRRGLLGTSWVLLMTPLHWPLLSLAAWRALYQFVIAPHSWEKTQHGLAKSSRQAANTTRALLQLERHLNELKSSGKLPVLGEDTRRARRAWPPARTAA